MYYREELVRTSICNICHKSITAIVASQRSINNILGLYSNVRSQQEYLTCPTINEEEKKKKCCIS